MVLPLVVVERVQFLFSIFFGRISLHIIITLFLLCVVVVSMSGLLLGCCSSSATTAAAAAAPRRRRVMVRASRFPAPSMGGSFSSKPSSESSSSSSSSFFKALLDPSSKRLATSSSSSSRFVDDDDATTTTVSARDARAPRVRLEPSCVRVYLRHDRVGYPTNDWNKQTRREREDCETENGRVGHRYHDEDNNEDYIYQNNYGAVKERFKKNARREERKWRITCEDAETL